MALSGLSPLRRWLRAERVRSHALERDRAEYLAAANRLVIPHVWNPRYLAYCRAMGTPDPDEQLALDRERWPGGCMTGFILWISSRWTEWRHANGYGQWDPLSEADHQDFTRGLG